MKRCIELAKKGISNVYLNPLVGSVVVHDDKIIGEGYHNQFGGNHAEVNAINSVKNKSLLKKSIIYVSLEPCFHFGKTPPCCNLIVEKKIPNVVIGSIDSFNEVNGKGIDFLKNNNVNTEIGILEKECRELNKRFFTFNEKKRPYVILKWAETKDGFISPTNQNQDEISWITDLNVQMLTHKWRTEESAILVGSNTVKIDNPSLTSRAFDGGNPIRIVIDRQNKLPLDRLVFDGKSKTLIINEDINKIDENLTWVKLNFKNNFIKNLLNKLFTLGVQSLIVEGGGFTLNSFIQSGIWDEARVLSSEKKYFVEGISAPKIINSPIFIKEYSESKISFYKN